MVSTAVPKMPRLHVGVKCNVSTRAKQFGREIVARATARILAFVAHAFFWALSDSVLSHFLVNLRALRRGRIERIANVAAVPVKMSDTASVK